MNPIPVPESAMVIVAHPDDIEFTCAGTLALWAKAGARISYVLCTSGEVGIDTPGMTQAQAAQIREAESREAARIAGASEVVFLREPDGLLEATLTLRKKIVRQIRRFRPEIVMCGDPTQLWISDDYVNHPDHRAASLAAIDATFPAAGQPNLFEDLREEGLKPHKPRRIYSQGGKSQVIDISETIETKIEALRAHVSQMKGWDPAPMLRQWAADEAKDSGLAYAETFRVVTLLDDETWEKYHGRVPE